MARMKQERRVAGLRKQQGNWGRSVRMNFWNAGKRAGGFDSGSKNKRPPLTGRTGVKANDFISNRNTGDGKRGLRSSPNPPLPAGSP